jgi:hypothetical protein
LSILHPALQIDLISSLIFPFLVSSQHIIFFQQGIILGWFSLTTDPTVFPNAPCMGAGRRPTAWRQRMAMPHRQQLLPFDWPTREVINPLSVAGGLAGDTKADTKTVCARQFNAPPKALHTADGEA